MKRYNRMILILTGIYLIIVILIGGLFKMQSQAKNREYLVGVHRMIKDYNAAGGYVKLDLNKYPGINQVSYLAMNEGQADDTVVQKFFEKTNQDGYAIQPLYIKGKLAGYLQITYETMNVEKRILYVTQIAMAILFGVVIAFLLYIRQKLVKPFFELSDMPYEMAKGHLKGELKEEKSRYFGRFVWGLNMLRDSLQTHQRKELELEKEKKLLLLSLSHDIKTPLNTIKLYAKALSEGLYDNEDTRIQAARRIEEHADEITEFVQEIMRTSSEEVIHIDVKQGEFYLEDLMNAINQTYQDKCSLFKIDFSVGVYTNKLLKGDIDRSVEVMENIIENAMKYGDGHSIHIEFYEEDYCQLIQITNSGEPMNENELNHVFDSFYRGSNAQGKQGCGLGLYICRDIMHKMNGEIFAKSGKDCMNFTIVFAQ